MSEVGFEPTPTFVDQNAQSGFSSQELRVESLESGALDRSAILTVDTISIQYKKLTFNHKINLFFDNILSLD